MKRLRTDAERRWTRLGRRARLTLVPLAVALLALAAWPVAASSGGFGAGTPQQTILTIYVPPRSGGRCSGPR